MSASTERPVSVSGAVFSSGAGILACSPMPGFGFFSPYLAMTLFSRALSAALRENSMEVWAEGDFFSSPFVSPSPSSSGPVFAHAMMSSAKPSSTGISATVVDMYCVKPLDEEAVIKAAENAKAVITVEEHAPYGGLGSMVSQMVGSNCPKRVVNIALPDAPVITGTSKEVFEYYGMTGEGIAEKAMELI